MNEDGHSVIREYNTGLFCRTRPVTGKIAAIDILKANQRHILSIFLLTTYIYIDIYVYITPTPRNLILNEHPSEDRCCRKVAYVRNEMELSAGAFVSPAVSSIVINYWACL